MVEMADRNNTKTLSQRMINRVDAGDWREGDLGEWNGKEGGPRWTTKEHQFEYMVKFGLKPDHYFLDIGCGWLRGGIQFIRYLDSDHYFAIDKEPWLLKVGFGGLRKYDLVDTKRPTVELVADFNVDMFNTYFDFMLAQSVFTHLVPEKIEECLANVMKWLKPGGKFYASFFLGEQVQCSEKHKNRVNEFTKCTQTVRFYQDLCKDKYKFTYIGNWEHKSGQELLLFQRL
jgi:hypothetical protein